MEHGYDLVLIGGSAGSVEGVLKIIPALNNDFSIPIVLVLHRSAYDSSGGFLEKILQNKTKLGIKEADEKEMILPHTVYVAPADYHLLIEHDHSISLDASEKIHFSRPSIDVTFECAAGIYGQRLIGILLSGASTDGTGGIEEIYNAGGQTIAQKPETASSSLMPKSAINSGKVVMVMTIEQMVEWLNGLAMK